MSGPLQAKFIDESALWERVRSRIEPGEKRWAVASVRMEFPDAPGTKSQRGFGFLTDQKFIFDVSETPQRSEPEHWMTLPVPFARVLGLGPSKVYGDDYLALQVLTPENPDGPIGSLFLDASGDDDFMAFMWTSFVLIERDGGPFARPEYRALLDKLAP